MEGHPVDGLHRDARDADRPEWDWGKMREKEEHVFFQATSMFDVLV